MTTYREYRGLYGEPVRVPTHTIAAPSRHYDRGSYPFVESAQRMGKDRDKLALIAMARRPFYTDAERDRAFRALAARAEPLTA